MGQARNIATSTHLWKRVHHFLDAVKFQESAFALPFAYSGMFLAANGWPTWSQCAWITIAMIGARSLGMAANRIIDQHIDADNPRTAARHLPAGLIRSSEMTTLAAAAGVIFLIAASQLNTLAIVLAPIAAAYLIFYPFTKRFTWAGSFFLGWALAIAPSAAWIGVRGTLSWEPVILSTAVALWAASFDILYHAQDLEFYTRRRLHSVSQRFGLAAAFRIAQTLDVLAVISLLCAGALLELAAPYYIGCAAAATVIAYKYRIASPSDTSRIGPTFMRTNALVSISVFAGTIAALFIP